MVTTEVQAATDQEQKLDGGNNIFVVAVISKSHVAIPDKVRLSSAQPCVHVCDFYQVLRAVNVSSLTRLLDVQHLAETAWIHRARSLRLEALPAAPILLLLPTARCVIMDDRY